MLHRFYLFLVLVLWFPDQGVAQAPEGWELKSNQDGIAIYTRKVPDQTVKQIKVLCELPGTPSQLVQIIKDVENHPKWVYLNQKATLLKKTNANHFFYYTQINMPWPVTDRDMISEAVVFPADQTKRVRIQVTGVKEYLPTKSGFVRIPASLALWEITPQPKNRVKVVYTFSVNPGGFIPGWMINNFVGTGPHITFTRLRELLEDQQRQKSK